MTPINFLLVDDEKPFIDTLAQRLRQRGFAVICAFSGMEALNQLDNDDTIEVVVLDVIMPGMDGIETIKRLKEKHPTVEVIMLTGHSTIHYAVEAIKLDAFDYLTKPCNINQLISKAEQAVSRRNERKAKIFDVRIKLYISKEERDEQIAQILKR
ncbi:response regulator [Desulfobacter hydrogenophilus]|uniref:Response regulator n=1 Tax=Desulfobacter hydrogenophilus TaxID=2291 RepID=A0A328FFW3_9BACT|nr:response regulator [Desulfobacter hydrogenophilus]NDY71236.1 response regulator [Desulfobacter hydrogenophilus]QBH15024.1 response regulator [Desulfobacter hydrogenophilus]RAM02730.1 response regulator [Desulfobacter hydrogenophilus]